MNIIDNYKLDNGIDIPTIGFGTWLIDNSNVKKAVLSAIEVGYTHIDTAQAYANESGVGEAINDSGKKRSDLFITTKLAAEVKNYDDAIKAIQQSLDTLNIEYIDLMLIHSPKPWSNFNGEDHYFEGNLQAWQALEHFYKKGLIKAIGVSNFEIDDLKNIQENASIKPMVNQVLAHIGNTPFELIEYCQNNDILVEAYSPFGHGELVNNSELISIAENYEVSVAQLCMKYLLQLDLLPLPKSENKKHMKSNLDLDFKITEKDMQVLKSYKLDSYGELTVFPIYTKL